MKRSLFLILSGALLMAVIFGFGLNRKAMVGSGIEKQNMDLSVRPQDDFFLYMNGEWIKTTEIPQDKASWGSFVQLREEVQLRLRKIIESAAQNEHEIAGSDSQKVGALYKSFMDEKKIEELGLKPLEGKLSKIAALQDKKEIPAFIGSFNKIGISMPIQLYIHQDAKDSTRYIVDLSQGGLGLPDRDYYLKQDDANLKEIRSKYKTHIEKMFTLMGDQKAVSNAEQIMKMETKLAQIQWSKVENRNSVKRYNKFEISKLKALVPSFDWEAYLKEMEVAGKVDYVIVSQPSFFSGFDEILKTTSLEEWKIYFRWRLIRSAAPYLSSSYVDENFSFYGTALSGVPQILPRWKRGVNVVEGALGESVGKIYVAQYFPPESKKRMEVMVENLLKAYRQSIETLDWMGPETKKEAQSKLAKLTCKIGYPNKWRDYSSLTIREDDLLGNVERSNVVDYQYEINKLGKPIDREEWGMTPQTVNAYYNPELNEIVFPASILQPPFFNAKTDEAVNYGGIGAVIGHEISHGFDDQGSRYDGNGNLRDWWTSEDRKNFATRTEMLIEQYNAFSPIPGSQVNGELTLGENIADNSGIAIAYKAYQLFLDGKQAPVIEGFTGDQRFFMGFAQLWRNKMRDAQVRVYLKTDPHSPAQFRVNGVLRNQSGFYQAFQVKEGDKMYLSPDKRVVIW